MNSQIGEIVEKLHAIRVQLNEIDEECFHGVPLDKPMKFVRKKCNQRTAVIRDILTNSIEPLLQELE